MLRKLEAWAIRQSQHARPNRLSATLENGSNPVILIQFLGEPRGIRVSIMAGQRIGIVHPGQMGIVVAVSAQNSGNEVFWASEGRGAATRERASQAGLRDAETLAKLCELCPVIVSVCPPEFAEEIAEHVARQSFQGTYVDANAIAPARTQRIARRLEEQGAHFVDGGIIGPPTTARNRTWLYLAGDAAALVASCFSAGPIETEVLEGGIGRASALKMCFAAYSKGSIALASAVLSAAENLDVLEDLKRQWQRSGPSLPELEREISRAAPKAWRFVAEMHEIAATFEGAGLPPEFHQAAAEIFRRFPRDKR
jgi:3-hydroxyisobutyrate dehydrogenase-like beta-hydroxyacid dehydrogenase